MSRRPRLSRLQCEVVETAAPEHRRLAVGLGVPLHLEHVELGPVADLDDGEPGAFALRELRAVPEDLGVEDLLVEAFRRDPSWVITATWFSPFSSMVRFSS